MRIILNRNVAKLVPCIIVFYAEGYARLYKKLSLAFIFLRTVEVIPSLLKLVSSWQPGHSDLLCSLVQ